MYRLQSSTNTKYYVNFAGTTIETTVTDKSYVAAEWVREITAFYGGNSMVVGLDVEWRPLPTRYDKPATLQLCVDKKCLILQLFYMDKIPFELVNFLMNVDFTFVGIGVNEDVSKLDDHYGLDCAKDGGYSGHGLQAVARKVSTDLAFDVCGLNMKKPRDVCMSNWEARVLSDAQVEYACIDAYASYRIGHKFIIEIY